MSQSAMWDWLAENLPKKIRDFGLGDWRIRVSPAEFNEPWKAAESTIQPSYRRAELAFDHEKIADEPILESLLEHELLHVCSDHVFDTAWQIVEASSMSAGEKGIARAMLTDANERTCRQLETLVRALRTEGLLKGEYREVPR